MLGFPSSLSQGLMEVLVAFLFSFLSGQRERRGEENLSVPWFPLLCIQGLSRPYTGNLEGRGSV